MDKIGKYTSTADGNDEFTEGDPSAGIPATVITEEWLNDFQREFVKVIQSMGLSLDASDDTLIWQSLQAIYGKTYTGDPNSNVAANVKRERCWDTSKSVPVIYYATKADGTVSGTQWTRAQDLAVGIGHYVQVQDDLTGADVPSNSGDAKFIRLTAGEDGAGQYNEGLLASESVSGSAPEVQATAVIDHADSPMNGETVHLINTERRFLRAGSSGAVEQDQMQKVTGSIAAFRDNGSSYKLFQAGQGALLTTPGNNINQPDSYTTGSNDQENTVQLDTANSPDARVSSGTNGETRPKNIGVTYYMRIV
jgi:hypothetical protein